MNATAEMQWRSPVYRDRVEEPYFQRVTSDLLIPVVRKFLPERLLIFGSSPFHSDSASLECEEPDLWKEFDDSRPETCARWMLVVHDGSVGYYIEVSLEL